MTSKQRVQNALNHSTPDRIPVDFGATSVTGIHCKVVEALRQHYGLDPHPVRVIEPFQMLGEIEEDVLPSSDARTCSISTKPNYTSRLLPGGKK